MNTSKGVISICPACNKKCFRTYKDALKFARKVEQANMQKLKARGSKKNRNVPKQAQKNMPLDKRVRSIYICGTCGFYHFSSITKPKQKKALKDVKL